MSPFEYQIFLYKEFHCFCKQAWWSNPPYCNPYQKEYFEEYFYKKFFLKLKNCNFYNYEYIYIPINWTYFTFNISKDIDKKNQCQKMINNLDPKYKYFTVCTHDNSPRLILPPNTKNFTASYFDINMNQNIENIPIPLIVQTQIRDVIRNLDININCSKEYLASFIGYNNNSYRKDLLRYVNNKNFFVNIIESNNLKHKYTSLDIKHFISKSLKSHFILCPRGKSPTSFRLYESMQMLRVPVYISDIFWLPWENEIDWNSMCIFVKPNNVNNLEEILYKELESGNFQKKISYIQKIYDKYFSFEFTFNKILKNIEMRDAVIETAT